MNKLSGIFDSHAHYDDPKFNKDRDTLLSSMPQNGVSYICNVGADIKGCQESVKLANKYDFIFCSVGIHPTYVENLPADWLSNLEKLAKGKKVVAIGETGLDYYCNDVSKTKQFDAFEKQINLAQSLNLPIIVHSRDATDDTISIIKNFPKINGVIHCFSGSSKTAEIYVNMGMYIGFTGVVTFKNAKKAVEVASVVPLDKLLIETDCPYMAPEPWRGTRCDSTMLVSVAEKLATLKEVSAQNIIDITRNNALNLYNIH